MKKLIFAAVCLLISACAPKYVVYGPQGGIATRWTYPQGFDAERDSCRMVILMHGIFSSKDFPPMPSIAKALAKQGIASVAIDFGGHGKSEGTKQQMTIAKELQEARALWQYVDSLPYITSVSLLGHSQGGVVASMLAGELAAEGQAPETLILLAPGSVIREATQAGHFFRNTFDPANPPEYIRCFGFYKVGREYMTSTQQLDIYGVSEQYQRPVCIIHGSKDGIVPLWCSQRYDSIYQHSTLHLLDGENHLMVSHLKETNQIILDFLNH